MMLPMLVAEIALLAQQAAPVQQAAPSVSGRVVNALTGEGLRKATVILRSSDADATNYADETDGNGRFHIDGVEPGQYSISALRDGYVIEPAGGPGAPLPRLRIAAGQQMDQVVVKLSPQGVVTGRILDQDGDPVRDATVRAMRFVYQAGRRQLQPMAQVQTWHDGTYRLFGLPSGEYYVQVQVLRRFPDDPSPKFPPTFYPGRVDQAGATPVEVSAGAGIRGFDITVRSEAGHSVRATGIPQDGATVSAVLTPRDAQPQGQPVRFINGTIEFPNVLPGSYTLHVTGTKDDKKTFARTEVEVGNADLDVGALSFQPAVEFTGRLKVEGRTTQSIKNLNLGLAPVDFSPSGGSRAEIASDGSFVFKNIAPGIYRFGLNVPVGQYLKSVSIDNQDEPDLRLDLTRGEIGAVTVVLGTDVGKIEGTVRHANGEAAAHARVTLFPEGPHSVRPDLFHVTFTDDQGAYHFDSVAPGEYRAFAWEDVAGGEPQDPEFRKRFEKLSATLRLASSGHEKVELTAIVTKKPQ